MRDPRVWIVVIPVLLAMAGILAAVLWPEVGVYRRRRLEAVRRRRYRAERIDREVFEALCRTANRRRAEALTPEEYRAAREARKVGGIKR